MSKGLALGVVIGGSVASSFGRAIGETTRGMDGLRARAEKTRGLHRLVGETIELRREMVRTVQQGGSGLKRLEDLHARNVARLKEHGVSVGRLEKEYTRLARAARSAEMMEAGRAQLGEGLAQGRQAMQIGGAVAATAAAPTMVAANYQAIIRDIAIKGGIARTGEETALAESIRRDASANGMDRNELAEAVNQLVAGGMEIKDAAGFASLIAKFAVGQNAGASDVSAMVLALKQAGVTDAKGMEKALGNIAVAGDLGSFEAKDMARHFATLMPQMTGFGISGEAATVGLANMLQTQMKAAGSADEAANNLRNLFSKITAQDTRKRFEDQGIDYDGSMQAAIAKGYDPVSAFIGLIEQSMQRTDPEKAKQLAKIQEQIAATEDPAARQKMLDGYLSMAGLTEFIGDQQAKQAALAAIQNKKLTQENLKAIKSADGQAKLEKDLNDRRDASQNKWKEAGDQFGNLMLKIGDAIRPITDFTADGISAVAAGMASLTEKYPMVASGSLVAAAGVASLVGAIGTLKMAGGALKMGRALLGGGSGGASGTGSAVSNVVGKVFGGKAGAAAGALLGGEDAQRVVVTNWPSGGVLDSISGKTKAGKAGGGMLGKALSFLGKSGGKLGGGLAVLGAVAGVYNTATTATTRDEKAEGYGGAAGTLAGGLAGAKAGAMMGALAGPLGAAAGGLIGAAIGSFGGDKLGGWLGKKAFGADEPPAPKAAEAAAVTAQAATPATPPPPANLSFAPQISLTVQGDVKDPRTVANELMPHLKQMFDSFSAQQQRAQLFDVAHV